MSFHRNRKTGDTVKLLAQDEQSRVTYQSSPGAKPVTVPSHQFFTDHQAIPPEELASLEADFDRDLADKVADAKARVDAKGS